MVNYGLTMCADSILSCNSPAVNHLGDVLEIADALTGLFNDSGALVLLGFRMFGGPRLTSTPERGRSPLRARITSEDEVCN